MVNKHLLYLLGALMFILSAGQPVQGQSVPDIPSKEKTCDDLWPVTQGGKCGYIDKTGRLIIPFKFDGAANFSEGLAAVKIKDKTGYIDKTGELVIQPRFISGFSFSDGLAVVVIRRFEKDGFQMHKFVYIDRSGKIVIQPREALDSKSFFVSMSFKELDFSEGLCPVKQDDKSGYGYIDKSGKMVIPPKYRAAAPFSEGLAAVKLKGKYGYINRFGKMVIPSQFDHARPFSEGLAYIDSDRYQGFIDKSGKLAINAEKFVLARRFSEGLAAVMDKDHRYGYIDKTGQVVIPPQFLLVGDFSEGLAPVRPVDTSWPGDLAYINQKGEIVIQSMSAIPDCPMKVESDLHYYSFCGGVARVSLGKEADPDAEGYINKEGKLIWPEVTPSKKELR